MAQPTMSVTSPKHASVTDLFKRLMHTSDRHCFGIVLAMFVPMIWLNYHDQSSLILDEKYFWFRDLIGHGFAPPADASLTEWPTFPIWGYGFVLLFSSHRLVLILLQALLATAAVWAVVRTLAQEQVMSPIGRGLLVFLVALSLPWYAQQTAVWPYSIAISLWTLALVQLVRGSDPQRRWIIIHSAVLAGMALNIRSDFWLLPIPLAIAWALLDGPRVRRAMWAGAWVGIILAMLVPWMLYTRWACGHAVPTSTNSGHVAFVGLGNLPDNRWGITTSDFDPVMHRLLEEKFGYPAYSMNYASDAFLKKKFVELITNNPAEYTRKCIHAARRVLLDGSYFGMFWRTSDDDPMRIPEYLNHASQLRRAPGAYLQVHGVERAVRVTLSLIAQVQGHVTVLVGSLLFPLVLWRVLRDWPVFLTPVSLLVGYQMALMVLVCHLPMYTANIYLWLLLFVAWTVDRLIVGRVAKPVTSTLSAPSSAASRS